MDKYEIDTLIGSGSFGKVYLVKSITSRTSYVMKVIDLNAVSTIEAQRALTEVKLLSKFKHKNIIRYKDAIADQTYGRLSIVMEYADGGDLSTVIKKQNGNPLSDNCVISWFIQICLALQYIHYQNILHRDLKTQNIFLTKNKVIKVGDFGIARVLKNSEDFAATVIGTPYYLSPEICQRKPYNYKSDIWALGCILFELAALEHPFKANNFMHLLSLISTGKRRPLPSWSSPVVRDLIPNLLNTDFSKRPSTDAILDNPLLQPYLTKYVHNHSRENISIPVDTRMLSTIEMCKSAPEIFGKRKAESSLTPRASKLPLISPNKEVENISRYGLSRIPLKPTSSLSKRDKIVPECNTYQFSASTHTKLPDPPLGMNVTYVVPGKTNYGQSTSEIKDTHPPIDFDCGYQSQETYLYNLNVKINGESYKAHACPAPNEERTESLTYLSTEMDCLDSTNGSRSTSSTCSKLSSSERIPHKCQHSQCHQCMLDMLWKNRIRACAGASVDTDEYLIMKNKLLAVFKNEFQKVYNSLLCDWKNNEMSSYHASIQSFVKTLNYDQVQHLPLMMQLIQLDLFMKTSGERNNISK